MGPDDPSDDFSGSPRKVPSSAGYFVILVGCLFAIFYTYKASREIAPAPMEQGQSTSQASDQAATSPSPKPGPAVAEPAPSVAQPKADAIPAQAVASPTPQPPQGPTPQPPQGAAPAPPVAAARAPAAGGSITNAPAPSQGTPPGTATQTAPSNDDLELAFNGHCRECHSFEKNDNRLGPNLYGVVGRKAGTVPNFAYSELVKGSGITWDEPTLDQWITNPNALIPGAGPR